MEKGLEVRYKKSHKQYKGVEVEYDEKYAYNPVTREEIYLKEFQNDNKMSVYEAYKKQQELLTSAEIKTIRSKYQMTQKEYSFALGFGEITVHRFEKGSIQSYADDEIMRLSNDPNVMSKLLKSNRDSFSEDTYLRLIDNVKDLVNQQRNRIARFEKWEYNHLTLVTAPVLDVAKCIAKRYNHQYDWLEVDVDCITIHKLQKLLYFTQGLSLFFYGRPAFMEKIICGKLGPEILEINEAFKNKTKIDNNDEIYLSNGLNKIVDLVIESYGQLESLLLVRMAKEEEPCRTTKLQEEIGIEKIQEYFRKIYE